MTAPPSDYPSGQPYSGPDVKYDPGPPPGYTITPSSGRAKASSSPRWLQVARDLTLTVAAVLVSLAIILTAVALNRAGNALGDLTDTVDTSTSEPCFIPDDPTCTPPGD